MTEPKRNHVLYRFYNDADNLLYVGITVNLTKRLEKHRHEKDWWGEVSRIDIEHFADRPTVLAAERTAIETEHPLHNIRMRRTEVTTLEWICEVCGNPIDDEEGYISLSYRELWTRTQQRKDHDERIEKEYRKDSGWLAYPLSALRDYPAYTKWHVLHRSCDEDIDEDAYWFGVERIRTLAEVLSWTAHLMQKNWLSETNWHEFIDRLAGRCGSTE